MMKLSKTSLMGLRHKYSLVLKKCAILNALALLGVMAAFPANAGEVVNGNDRLFGDDKAWELSPKQSKEKVDKGRIWLSNFEEGTYEYDEDKAILTVKANENNQIVSQKFQAGIQTYNPNHTHPTLNVLGDAGTTLDMSANEDDWLIVSRFAKVNIGTKESPIGKINLTDTALEKDGGSLIYVTAGNNAADADFQELNIYGNDITLKATLTDGTNAPAITGNEGRLNLVANNSLDITGNIEAFNGVYGGHANMKFDINTNEGNTAVTTIKGDINAAKGSEVNIGLKGAGSSITGNLLVSAEGTKLPGGNINLSFGKNGRITGNLTAQDAGKISVAGTDTVNIAGNISVGENSTFAGKNIAVNGTLTGKGNVQASGKWDVSDATVDAGAITFEKDASLTAELQKTQISAKSVAFEGNNTLNLKVANSLTGADYDFIKTETLNGRENVTIAENALYNLKLTEDGKINVSVKSGAELVKDTPATAQEAAAISAVAQIGGNGTDTGNAVAEAISAAMQSGDKTGAVKAVKDLAPTTSQEVMGVAQGVNNILSNIAGVRMSAVNKGRSGGAAFTGGAVWAQGLYNHTKQDSNSATEGFKADTTGVAFGIDGKVNENLMFGIGYGYSDTDSDAGSRDIDVDGHNFFVYSEYKPSNWYVNGMLNYGFGKYTEKKAPAGIALKSKYDVNTYAANVMTGYDFTNGLTPEAGLRYLLADQESYTDGVQHVKAKNNDVLTGVVGVKYHRDYTANKWSFKPNLRLAATYDMMSDDSEAMINVIGGGSYQITGERLHRFGVETGVGLEASVGKWNLSLNYDGGFRKDYQSHTGMLRAKYNF